MPTRFTPRRQAPATEFQLGTASFGRIDGDFEATLVVTPGGEPRVRLTQLGWGAGVGWYAQRTLELGVEEAHQIAALLARAPKDRQAALDELPAASVAQQAGRPPIDLAKARARRVAAGTRTAPGRTGPTGQAPTPISSCDRAAPPSDEAATR